MAEHVEGLERQDSTGSAVVVMGELQEPAVEATAIAAATQVAQEQVEMAEMVQVSPVAEVVVVMEEQDDWWRCRGGDRGATAASAVNSTQMARAAPIRGRDGGTQ